MVIMMMTTLSNFSFGTPTTATSIPSNISTPTNGTGTSNDGNNDNGSNPFNFTKSTGGAGDYQSAGVNTSTVTTPTNNDNSNNNSNKKASAVSFNLPSTPTPTPTTNTPKPIIEICTGNDCSSSGGGAALLEIEELVMESSAGSSLSSSLQSQSQSQYQIVSGGCRNKCSIGPNVYHNHNVTTHYSKVNSAEECEKVVRNIMGLELQYNDGITTNNEDSSARYSNVAARIMMKKASKTRWKFLRKVAAVKRKKKLTKYFNEELQTLHCVELAAIKMIQGSSTTSIKEKNERAERRLNRFQKMIE